MWMATRTASWHTSQVLMLLVWCVTSCAGIKRVTLLPPGSIERMGDMDGSSAQNAVTAKAFLLHPGLSLTQQLAF